MKQEYIEKITELLDKCPDLAVLDLIYQLLLRRTAPASQPAAVQNQD